MSGGDLAALLSRCLRAAGVTRAFRASGHDLAPLPGIDVIDVGDPELAALLADADGRLSRAPAARPGLALLPGPRLRLSSQPGEQVLAQPLLDARQLPAAIAGWSLGAVHAALELDIDVDLAAPAATDLQPLTLAATSDRLLRLSETLATLDIVIVVGPGVVRDGQEAAVVEAARRTGARVVATLGAVGVLPLDDPAWRGVVGLQDDDAALAGVVGAELVIVAGTDPAEAAGVVPDDAQVLEVEPWQLGLMAHHWPDPRPDPERASAGRRLVDGLAALAAAGRSSEALPLHPARAVADLADVVDPSAVIAADAGPAGLWVGRGLVGLAPGSVVVPALPVRGFAAAAALVAGLDGRPAVAVVTSPPDEHTEALLDLAARLGAPLVCEVWGAEASWATASEHRARLVGALHEGGVQRLAVPVDLAATRELVELAGPVRAWTAPPGVGTPFT